MLDAGLVIALRGPLGAGKTGFVKGLAEGLGVDPGVVSSPTFVIAQEYPEAGRGVRLVHLDLYRLEGPAELEATGFLDSLDARSVVAIEWADRIPEALPADHLEITLARTVDEDAAREVVAAAFGWRTQSVLRRWGLSLDVAGTVALETVPCP